MKKVLAGILSVVCIAVFLVFENRNTYPKGMVYNYMTSSVKKNLTVSTDNYVVSLFGNKKIVYSKSDKNIDTLAQTVFDTQETGTDLIGVRGDILYYIAIDKKTGGSAIFEFDLNSLNKKKLDTVNKVSNAKAFLGINTVIGIDNSSNDIFSIMLSDVWFNKHGRHSRSEISKYLSEKDSAKEYGTDNMKGVCTTDEYIFFLNGLCSLYKYTYSTDDFQKISDQRITDFFITCENIYYYSADDEGKLMSSDYNGDNVHYIKAPLFTDVHVHNNVAYAQTESGEIYEIVGDKIRLRTENVETKAWDADDECVYVFDLQTGDFDIEK